MRIYKFENFHGLVIFFFFLRILSIFNTHGPEERRRFLKKFKVMYIQKCLTLEYIVQALNFFKASKNKTY